MINSQKETQTLMKNYIPKDQLIKKYEEQKGYKKIKNNTNQNTCKVNINISNSNTQTEESKVDGKNLPEEKHMEIIYES